MVTVAAAGVNTGVTRTVPAALPTGRAVWAVVVGRAAEAAIRPTWVTPTPSHASTACEVVDRRTFAALPAHAKVRVLGVDAALTGTPATVSSDCPSATEA